jgi:hypothetical protein
MSNATETKTIWSNGATTMSAARLILGTQYSFDISGLSWDAETVLVSKDGTQRATVTPKKDAHGTHYAVKVVAL